MNYKYLYLLIIFVPLLLPGVTESSEGLVSLQRATMPVGDLDRTIEFYEDTLGFSLRSRTPYDTPALRAMFPMPKDAEPVLALLDGGPDQPRVLALVQVPGQAVDAEANRQHAPALLFNTAVMDGIHARMIEAGAEILLPPSSMTDFSGKPFGREAAYLDPDGVRIILFEVNPQ